MSHKRTRLSKTRILQGIQCPKAAYLTRHRPDLIPPVSTSQQAIFDQGHDVGAAARELFPGGVLIGDDDDISQSVAETAEAIASGAMTLFEGTFSFDDVVVKVDVLRRSSNDAPWKLIEVKSTTSVKDQHIDDVAIQAYVLKGAGIQIEGRSVMHLNGRHVAAGPEPLFSTAAVDGEVDKRLASLPAEISTLKKMLTAPDVPAQDIGPHCDSPYSCAFKTHCWKHVPSPSIFEIPRFDRKVWDSYRAGVIRLDDDRLGPFEGTRSKQVDAARTGKRWVDAAVIGAKISPWKWPLHFLAMSGFPKDEVA